MKNENNPVVGTKTAMQELYDWLDTDNKLDQYAINVIQDKIKELSELTTASPPVHQEQKLYIHIDFNTHVATLLDEEEKNIWENDGSCESNDELYEAVFIKKY